MKNVMVSFILLSSLGGCATTQITDPRDPWEDWNRSVHTFNEDADARVMKPVAKVYDWIMPDFVDRAISNVFSNLDDIGVAVNDSLQGKFTQSGMDMARFVVNSTAGVAGLIDVASMIDLPKHQEDFGQTLGFWGVPSGPYLVLPFFGSSSPRGVAGLVGDAALNPISYVGSFYAASGIFVLDAVDTRTDNLGTEKIVNEAATFGRYEFFRDTYIELRNSLVLDGNVPEEENDFILDESFDDELIP